MKITEADFYGFVTASAPGRVNLITQVGPQRADGYHELGTASIAISLTDLVKVQPRPDGIVDINLSEATPFEDAIGNCSDPSVIVAQAIAKLQQKLQLASAEHGVEITITKNLPTRGGVGGTAAIVAATLMACAALWDVKVSKHLLAQIGEEISTQIPFAMTGGATVGSERGEVISPVLTRGELNMVLIPARSVISPEKIYATHRELISTGVVEQRTQPGVSPEFLHAMTRMDVEQIAVHMHNDLQPAVIAHMPELGDLLNLGMAEGALSGMVCGTGPSLMFLTYDGAAAVKLASRLEERTEIQCLPVHGPVTGAHIR